MSLGRVTAAAISGTVDATVALAAINFDFSIVKIEARKEYKDLGLSLSKNRSNEAEQGETHVTARKLGALFGGVVPSTTNLFQAYGLRASEIANSRYNPRGSRADGIFADHVGADATTIWAAATSGDAAIAVHLLACMLARMWPGPEATSIWVELVEDRKKELSKPDHQDSIGIAQLTTSRIILPRKQLSKWDASARAWLSIADEAKALPQTQLMLILNNLRSPMSRKESVYASVLDAWKTSMVTLDNLLSGTHQSIYNPAPLLGLASWHLYPDMLVLGNATKKVEQNDQLMASGGLLTIGFHSLKAGQKGVTWSLPLAHLKFYGDPVLVQGVLSHDTSRVSMDQLLCVALGALIGPWLDSMPMVSKVASLLVHMKDLLYGDPKEQTFDSTWLCILGETAEAYLSASETSRTEQRQLIYAGIRRYSNFLGRSTNLPPPAFGLLNFKNLLSILDGPEARIGFLRHLAKTSYFDTAAKMIIQYQFTVPCGPAYGYATVCPVEHSGRGRKRDRQGISLDNSSSHVRWLEKTNSSIEWEQMLSFLKASGEKIIPARQGTFVPSFSARGKLRWVDAPDNIFDVFEERAQATSGNAAIYEAYEAHERRAWFRSENTTTEFDIVLGDQDLAAIFISSKAGQNLQKRETFWVEDVTEAFTQRAVSQKRFLGYLQAFMHRDESTQTSMNTFEHYSDSISIPKLQNELAMSLQGLATAVRLYKSLPGARVSLKVANRPLCDWRWLGFKKGSHVSRFKDSSHMKFQGLMPLFTDQAQTFAAIATFESGSFNAIPQSLASVMALSCGNSIYVADRLLRDPWLAPREMSVRRVVGNLGRPGMVMMIPPGAPRTTHINESSWQSINHDEFDGVTDDSFQQSTLHLSFSGWELEVDTGNVGSQDSEFSMVEAPVALHDRGDWVADLDILKIFQSEKLHRVRVKSCDCSQKTSGKQSIPWDLTSIDKWEELLESPIGAGIVRAYGNWQARLAAAALSIKLRHDTYLLPPETCWNCYVRLFNFAKPKLHQSLDLMGCTDDEEDAEEEDPEDMGSRTEDDTQHDSDITETAVAGPVRWDSEEDSESDLGALTDRERSVHWASDGDDPQRDNITHHASCDIYVC